MTSVGAGWIWCSSTTCRSPTCSWTRTRTATAATVPDVALWDVWALARSHDAVGTWAPNYVPLGRDDLTEPELRRRHARWTERLRASMTCSGMTNS